MSGIDMAEGSAGGGVDTTPFTIAVLGAGVVGVTLATGWARVGHDIVVGSREPQAPKIDAALARIRSTAREGAVVTSGLHSDAIRLADLAVVTVPGVQVDGLLAQIGPGMRGKVAIDATNSPGPFGSELNSMASLARAGAISFRAFNTTGYEQMAQPMFGETACDLVFSGPDGAERSLVECAIVDLGFRPVYLGDGPEALAGVDAVARLWFQLAFAQGWGRRLGLRFLTEADDDPAGQVTR